MMRNLVYQIKPFIPRIVQIAARRQIMKYQRLRHANIWPINPDTSEKPRNWRGWPDQKQFAVILTHDVETAKGQAKCNELMNLETSLGFHSSFNFVPERYNVCPDLRTHLIKNGFEVGVHGLNHDGKLYSSIETFRYRATIINKFLKEWEAVGFRSPSMHHNLEWLHNLDIKYDLSTFDTDPFEPQSDGVNTIFPFWVQNGDISRGYVELPYTLPQDFTLFIIMKENNIHIWKQKLDWIADRGGMVLLNTHPDYMNFNGKKLRIDEYPIDYYKEFLTYLQQRYNGDYWHGLPKDITLSQSKYESTYSQYDITN